MRGPLLALHEGCLCQRQQRLLAAHVERCGECRAFLERLAETDALLRNARPVHGGPLPEPSHELFCHALRAAQRQRSHPFLRTATAWGIAGVLALLGANAASNRRAATSQEAVRPEFVAVASVPGVEQLQGPDDGMRPRAVPADRPSDPEPRVAVEQPAAVKPVEKIVAPRPERYQLCAATTLLVDPSTAEVAPQSEARGVASGLGTRELALGSLIVEVSQPKLEVEVHDAPSDAPGYARATALTQDAAGTRVLAQYTLDSTAKGSELIVTPAPQEAESAAIACASPVDPPTGPSKDEHAPPGDE
jgi:hypothetical protein